MIRRKITTFSISGKITGGRHVGFPGRLTAAKRGFLNCKGCREEVAIIQDGVVPIWRRVFSNAGTLPKCKQNRRFSFDWFNIYLLLPADTAYWTAHPELRIRRQLSAAPSRSELNKTYRSLRILKLSLWGRYGYFLEFLNLPDVVNFHLKQFLNWYQILMSVLVKGWQTRFSLYILINN